MSRVFISYRHVEPDTSLARALYARLSDADHDVFLDAADIPLGAMWDKQIARNVESADYFIPLVSASYLHSPYILDRELGPAADRLRNGKLSGFLQINLAYDGEPPDAVRDVLAAIQFVKWRSAADTARVLDQVGQALPHAQVLLRGMRAYQVSDADQFAHMGRDRELDAAVALIRSRAGHSVLLHGVSGAGKSSFIRAGLVPRLGCAHADVVELTGDSLEELASFESASGVLFLDQFEQTLVRISHQRELAPAFAGRLSKWLDASRSTVVFCIRDEYRTAFDAMLPAVAQRCVSFPLLPFQPEVAGRVLVLLLDNAQVKHDAGFARELCEQLAEGVPRTILPALLQLITQHCRTRGVPLSRGTWERLAARGSIFQDHVRRSVLDLVPKRISRLRACEALAALTAGDVKSPARTAGEIAADSRTDRSTVQATLDMATLPHARVVRAEDDGAGDVRYRLVHDLFVSTIRTLLREARLRHERLRAVTVIAALAALLCTAAAFWYRSYRQGLELARREQLAVAAQLAAFAQASPNLEAAGLRRGLLLAIESVSRFGELGESSAESTMTLHQAMNLMPRRIATVALPDAEILGFCAEGRHLIARDRTAVWSWDPYRGEAARKIADAPGRVALSHSNALLALATVDERGGPVIRIMPLEGSGDAWSVALNHEEGRPPVVQNLMFSPDDSLLGVAAGVGILMDVRTLREINRLTPLIPDDLVSVVFAGDNRLILGINDDSEHTLWDLRGSTVKAIRLPKGKGFLQTDEHLFLPSRHARGVAMPSDKVEQLSAVLTDRRIGTIDFHRPAGLVAVVKDEDVVVHRLADWSLATMPHASYVESIDFSRDGSQIATTSRDGTARLWETGTGQEIARLVHGPYNDAVFAPDKRIVIVSSSEGLSAWEANPDASHVRLSGEAGSLAYSSDGRLLARASDRVIVAIRVEDGSEAWRLQHNERIATFVFSDDNRYLASGATNGRVRFWDVERRREIWSVKTSAAIQSLSIAPRSTYVAAAASSQAFVWNARNGGEVLRQQKEDTLGLIAVLPGGHEVLTAGSKNPIEITRIADGVVSARMNPSFLVRGAAFRDGRLAVYGDTEVRVFDTANWKQLATFSTLDRINAFAFAGDQMHFAVGTGDPKGKRLYTVQIVRLAPVRKVDELTFRAPVTAVAFGAEDRFLTVASALGLTDDKTVGEGNRTGTSLWTWRPDDVRSAACERLTRNLNRDEWRDAFGSEPCRAICPKLPACN